MALAIARLQQNSTAQSPAWQYLYNIRNAPLAWLGQEDPTAPPLPEIVLSEEPPTGSPIPWTWRSKLLDAARLENAFTVDPVRYTAIAKNSDGTTQYEYDGDEGDTLRFGDGIFGQAPEEGAVFRVSYRSGGGAIGNVASDTITRIDPAAASIVTAVTNPFAATGGADQEPNETVQRLAPQAFRAKQFRAVRPEDYQEAATRLSWVQRAGTAFRWTGSWLTVFTTADPKGSEQIAFDELISLIDLLNRYRMVGYESYAPPPRYVGLDLKIQVCARPDAFRGDVQEAILAALSSSKNADGTTGFFFIDNFTFGKPLEPSAIEAVIQNAYGVGGVISVRYRRRGYTNDFVEMTDAVRVAADEIIRVDNDPSRPERGSIEVKVEGGK
jgi:predicted phage baseplate assembly protein